MYVVALIDDTGDSGLDELSCFFRNSDGSTVARSSYLSPTFDLSKRKVVQYIDYMDATDEAGGAFAPHITLIH